MKTNASRHLTSISEISINHRGFSATLAPDFHPSRVTKCTPELAIACSFPRPPTTSQTIDSNRRLVPASWEPIFTLWKTSLLSEDGEALRRNRKRSVLVCVAILAGALATALNAGRARVLVSGPIAFRTTTCTRHAILIQAHVPNGPSRPQERLNTIQSDCYALLVSRAVQVSSSAGLQYLRTRLGPSSTQRGTNE